MNQEVQERFEKAAECVEDAQLLFRSNRFAATVNRAYYAMFHAATAVLLKKKGFGKPRGPWPGVAIKNVV